MRGATPIFWTTHSSCYGCGGQDALIRVLLPEDQSSGSGAPGEGTAQPKENIAAVVAEPISTEREEVSDFCVEVS